MGGASRPGFGSHSWVGLQAPSRRIGPLRVLHRFVKSPPFHEHRRGREADASTINLACPTARGKRALRGFDDGDEKPAAIYNAHAVSTRGAAHSDMEITFLEQGGQPA